ncbi:hypothetical protein FHT02_002131 [Sphingomonas xinjiangensis]|uniref:Ankyrin repeat domain-containing protein n=2 Tax=Sphingomonas xinjiangensis TaxID=643568 RepID=A0A840YQ77_9SPHN|nr:hypothetical protein [Sphingomonas xinjiangensis]
MAAADINCFSKRPSVVRPDRNRVLASLSNGASGRTLADAILDGRVDEARAILTRDPRLIDTAVLPEANGIQPPAGQYGDLLTLAVSRCDADAARMLFDQGMPRDGVLAGNALSLAILADDPRMAELLLRSGASPDPQQRGGEDPMRAAITFSHIGGVMTLLRHGADPRWSDSFGIDRVRLALDAEQAEIAELLVDKGGTLWSVAGDGSMAAHELLGEPVVFGSDAAKAARARLIARAKQDGIGWPPPNRATVKRMVTAGNWPTADMVKAGVTVAPAVLEKLRAERH